MSNDIMRPHVGWFRRTDGKAQDAYDKANDQGIALAQEGRLLREKNELAKALATLRDAESYLRKACEIEPQLHYAEFNLGVILFEEAVLLRSNNDEERALALLDEADLHFQKALDIEPALVVADLNLGGVAFERAWLLYDQHPMQAEAQFAKAEAHARKVLERKPDWADAENNLGNSIFERAGLVRKRAPEEAPALYREAETHYQKALEIDPKCFAAERYWGRVLFALAGFFREYARGDTVDLCVEAEAHYRKAIALKPDFAEALDDCSSVLLWKTVALRAQGRTKEVSKAVADALHLLRQHARLTGRPSYNLACVLALTGKADLALATLEELIKIGVPLNPAWLRRDPDLDSVRKHKRFQSLLKSLEAQIS